MEMVWLKLMAVVFPVAKFLWSCLDCLAYQTRSLAVAFNESQYVGVAVFSIFEALLFGVPIVILVYSNPVASYMVRVLWVFVVCMVVLGFMFIPKHWMQDLTDDTIKSGVVKSGMDGSQYSNYSTTFK